MTFWSLHSGYRAKQCSLGVLPACVLARAVPNGGNVWLNIDFARARKLRPARIAGCVPPPGKNCRSRQIMPSGLGKYFHFSEKFCPKNPANPRRTLAHGE